MKKLLLYTFFLCIARYCLAEGANSSIKGKVATSEGEPAADVTIVVKGTGRTTVTGTDGSFMIRNLPTGHYQLLISLVGYQTVVQEVTLRENETTNIDIQLQLTQKELEAVIVRAGAARLKVMQSEYVSKMPLKNLENPQVYTTITADLLKQQMVFSVDDATRNAPGLQRMWEATARSGDGGAYYNARGFILQSQLRNGVAGNVTSSIDAANLERLEVIKGPSATLFGSTLTSYGGLINRVTKKPYDHFGGELSYAGGSYGFNRLAVDVNTPVDSAGKLLFRLNAAYHHEGSFQDNGFDKGGVIAPSLSYTVNDRLSFLLDAELYSGSNSSKQMIFFYYPAAQLGATRADQLGIDYKRSYSSNDIFQTSGSRNFFAQMNYKLSERWKAQTFYTGTYSNSDGPYAYFYVLPNAVYTGNPAATGADYLVRADQSTANNDMQVTELQQIVTGDFNTGSLRNRFVGGLDYFAQNSNQLFFGVDPFDIIPKNGNIAAYGNFNRHKLDSALQGNNVWQYPYRYKTKTYSAFASDVLNLTDRLLLLAALRVDRFNNMGSYDEATSQYTGHYEQTGFSPKFGLVYQIARDKLSLFANYQNGFTNQTGTSFEGKTFKPEHADQKEGGVKLNVFDGKLTSTLSYYSIKVKDMVRPDPVHPNFSIQDGTQVSKGFEADILTMPAAGLNLIAGFAYNDSRFEKADADVEGRRPATAMSPYTANLWAGYQMQTGAIKGLGFGFGGNYASDNKIENSVYYGVFILPSYVVLNAGIFYDQSTYRVGLKVDNLTNKEYWIGYTTMNPQKLRSVTGSISFRF